MELLGIWSYNTYNKVYEDLLARGFIKEIQKSKNQYSSRIIAISKTDKALDEPLDKATIKASDKTHDETCDTIDKQITNKQINNNISIDKSIDTKSEDFEEQEYIPSEITKKVNDVIENIKSECRKNWILYASGKSERNFAKHLLSDKFRKEALDHLNIDLNMFISKVIKASVDLKYAKTINNAVSLYYNRSDIVNKAIKEKTNEREQSSKTYVIR